MQGPNPAIKHPIPMHPRVGFLKPLVTAENIEIGDFTYYDDPEGPDQFQTKCVLHHYPFIGDRLIIGKFCAIAEGARFIMNGANHAMSGFSTYPFNIFGHGWEQGFDPSTWQREVRGDTVVGNDVWIGMEAVILPGIDDRPRRHRRREIGGHARCPALCDRRRKSGQGGEDALRQEDGRPPARTAWWDWPIDKIGAQPRCHPRRRHRGAGGGGLTEQTKRRRRDFRGALGVHPGRARHPSPAAVGSAGDRLCRALQRRQIVPHQCADRTEGTGADLQHARPHAGTQLFRPGRPFGRGRRPAADGAGRHARLRLCLGAQGEGRRVDEARLRLSQGQGDAEARLSC